MLKRLAEIHNKPQHLVVGLMSGTSADGIDAALCELSGEGRGGLKLRLVAEHTEPYPDFMRDKIMAACDPAGVKPSEICELNFLLGEAFAQAANNLIESSSVKHTDVDLIGSHGQTIWHIPPRGESFQLGSTLQLGEPAVIAERTGITVVSNFRTRDMAAGGQGAPLVPIVDYLLFSNPSKTRVVLNIGGISNVTYLPSNGELNAIMAYDTGPGNMVIDAMVQYMTQNEEVYDKDGTIAASGTVGKELLEEMLKHEYLQRSPPKSTGREEFGADFAMKMYDFGVHHRMMPRDVVATATAFTAATIAQSVKNELEPKGKIDELIVSGGGALNPVLMSHLSSALPGITIGVADDYGMPLKAKESIAFAILARESFLGRPANVPSATGASGPRVLGQITMA